MTNKEVIEVLEKEESYMLSHGGDRQAKALRIAINKIEQEHEWISVAERLPEESDDYLITNIAGDVEMAYFAHPKDYTISKGEWREICYEEDIIAWMQLPQPYKTESER